MSPRPNKNSFEGKWNLVQLEGIAQTNLILTGIHYAHVQILHTSGSYECLLPDILSNILYGYMDPKWAAQSGQGNLLLNLSKKIWGGHWHPDIPTCPVCPCVSVYDGSNWHHCTLLATTLWTPVPPGLMEKKPAIDMVPLKLQTYTRIHMTMTRGDVDML